MTRVIHTHRASTIQRRGTREEHGSSRVEVEAGGPGFAFISVLPVCCASCSQARCCLCGRIAGEKAVSSSPRIAERPSKNRYENDGRKGRGTNTESDLMVEPLAGWRLSFLCTLFLTRKVESEEGGQKNLSCGSDDHQFPFRRCRFLL
jgi:hypothetical protein